MYPPPTSRTQLPLIAGVTLLYLAGRAATHGNLRALGYWVPIATVAIFAVLLQQPLLAIELVMATSVASLSLVGGCVAVAKTHSDEPALAPTRTSAFLLPAALLCFLAGFAGNLSWLAATLLLIEGAVILFVRLDPAHRQSHASRSAAQLVKLSISAIVCIAGAWFTIQGSIGITHEMDFVSPIAIATTALSPLLVAPMLLGGTSLAHRGQSASAADTQVVVAQLNLCLLLPVLTLLSLTLWHQPLPFPMSAWRVDAVVLILLAALRLPPALDRWTLGRLEGVLLIAVYVGYVLAVIAVTAGQ